VNYLFLDASSTEVYGQVGTAHDFFPFQWNTERNLASRLTRLCEEMLDRAGLRPYDIARFGLGTGPGSLTGLRVAASFMRTLALATDSPLTPIDLFTWSAHTLAAAGVTGPVRLTVPALLNQAFVVELDLPLEMPFIRLSPRLDLPGPSSNGIPTFGIRCESPGVHRVDPSPAILHDLMQTAAPTGFDALLKALPLYVVPSQAELNLEKRRSSKQ